MFYRATFNKHKIILVYAVKFDQIATQECLSLHISLKHYKINS